LKELPLRRDREEKKSRKEEGRKNDYLRGGWVKDGDARATKKSCDTQEEVFLDREKKGNLEKKGNGKTNMGRNIRGKLGVW